MDNPCLVCQKKEAVDSGMCEDCYDKACDYAEQKYYEDEEEKRLKKVKIRKTINKSSQKQRKMK